MQKIILLLLFLCGVIYAQNIRTETSKYISYSVNDRSFKEVYLLINNELQVNAFSIVYEINIAKTLESVSKSLEKKSLLKKGVTIGFCKQSLSYQLVKNQIEALLFCPFKILIFETRDSENIIVSFLKAPLLNDKIDSKKLDVMIENIITTGLD